MPPNEKILSLSFEIRMPEARGMLNVALPAAVSNALMRKLAQQGAYRQQRSTADSALQIGKRLESALFPIELVLPYGRVAASQLLTLKQGDLVKLRCPLREPANLLISGKRLFRGYPVRSGMRRAAQVKERVQESELSLKEKA